jgi:alanyl-tRNA synthetase
MCCDASSVALFLRGQRVLGIEQPFFADLAPAVVDALGDHYPELAQRQEYLTTTLRYEEQRFRHTVQAGLARLEEMLADAETQQTHTLAGERVFTLYDTYGFPVELTQEIAAERGVAVDMQGFERAMDGATPTRPRSERHLRETVRANGRGAGGTGATRPTHRVRRLRDNSHARRRWSDSCAGATSSPKRTRARPSRLC